MRNIKSKIIKDILRTFIKFKILQQRRVWQLDSCHTLLK